MPRHLIRIVATIVYAQRADETISVSRRSASAAERRAYEPGEPRCGVSGPADASNVGRVLLDPPMPDASAGSASGRTGSRTPPGSADPTTHSRPNALSVFEPSFTNSMIAPAQAKALTRLSVLNFSGGTFAYAHATGIAVRSPGQEAAGEDDQRFVRLHVCADAIAVLRQLRKAVEPVDAAAQQVEPDLVAERAADRAGAPDAGPVQLADHRVRAHLAVVDLALEHGEDDDGQVGQHSGVFQHAPYHARHALDLIAAQAGVHGNLHRLGGARAPSASAVTAPNSSMSGGTSTCSVSMSMPRRTQRTTSSSRWGPSGPITQYW